MPTIVSLFAISKLQQPRKPPLPQSLTQILRFYNNETPVAFIKHHFAGSLRTMTKRWVQDHRRDSWRRQAKEEGYRARSAWKLKQIQDRFEVIRKHDVVLDVGCHPGGWAQVAVECSGERGEVVGIDLMPCQPVEGALLLVGDITDSGTQARVRREFDEDNKRPINAVVSDISPDITGNWDIDQAVSIDLVAKVFDFSLPLLAAGGSFVTKIFQGVGVDELIQVVKPHFTKVRRFSPDASRNSSSEVYLICLNHRPWKAPKGRIQARWEEAVTERIASQTEVAPETESVKKMGRILRRKQEEE